MRRKAKKERKFSKEKRRRRRSEIEEYAWRDVYEIDNARVELLRSQDTCAVGCTSGRSSEIDETKVARNTSLKDRHTRGTKPT